ncbi:MAG TPA: hypothetical protein VJR87_01090 [Allosphingosinicella sp.]|nr:hypothetical protein [Allosphingosinicella sp.]
MQRVRIGLTGLALVFVLVLLGAVIRSASDDGTVLNGMDRQRAGDAAANAGDAEPTEPLAELGVAPGNADSNSSADAHSGNK